jgi:outer membrane lipoprotein SlyB
MNKILTTVAIASFSLLAACTAHQSANTYTTVNAQQKLKVSYAVITGLREVQLENAPSGAGGVAGAGVGGVLGSSLGEGRAGIIGTITGAVIGGVTGVIADKAAHGHEGLEITYRMEKTGDEFVTAQARKGSENLKVGQRVRIVESEDSTRVVPAE